MTQQSLSTYQNLCTQVYDLSKPTPPIDAYEFYRSYAMQAKNPILEPMCGTGRFLLPLLQEGFEVQGFDASEDMLAAMKSKLSYKKLAPVVWKGFVEDLKRPEKYDLIFIPSGSFGLITNPSSAKSALHIFYDHLSVEGVLLFEVETLKSAPSQFGIWKASVWHREDGRMIILNTLDLPIENNISTTLCRYELVDGNSIVQTEIEKFQVQLYHSKDMIKMLSDTGFKNIRMVKAFDKTKTADPDDEVIVFECS